MAGDHFNPSELRDPHSGKWSKGGAVIDRLAKEAAGGHERATAQVRTIEPGKGKQVNGHWVERPASGAYVVKLRKQGERGRDTRTYDNPEDAGRALASGSHASPATERAVREVTRAPAGKAPAVPEKPSPGSEDYRAMTAAELSRRVVAGRDQKARAELDRRQQERRAAASAPRQLTPAEQLMEGIHDVQTQIDEQHAESGAPHYSARELAQIRSRDIQKQLDSGEQRITIKVPSGSEISMPSEVARELLGMPAKKSPGMTPELQEQLRGIQAAEKARMEAENKATGRSSSTEYKNILARPDLRGGATPPKSAARYKAGDRVVYKDKSGKEHTASVTRAYTVPRSPEPNQYTIKLDTPTGRYQETTRDVPHSSLRKIGH